jgi:hypothetical protein
VLGAICDDPRKYWLLGDGTESWAQLTQAHAALHDIPVAKVRQDFQPNPVSYGQYCEQLKEERALLEYCREKGITGREEIGGAR